ncbi:MAG: alpha/beta hydrolase [Verrucomicrobia bacterium]|nr:alpha/beta hydrolase [Verrucomicrobiota bacterium]
MPLPLRKFNPFTQATNQPNKQTSHRCLTNKRHAAYGPTVLEEVPLAHLLRRAAGLQLHCVEAGPTEGSPVVLLHGFPEGWWCWGRQIAPLARAGLRVVIPDQRGYGTSDKPPGVNAYQLDALAADVMALADTLGSPRLRLVGHDWGGVVAWWTATHFPDRVDRLAILNAPHPAVARRYLRRSPTQALRSAYVGFFQLPFLPEIVLRARGFWALAAMMRVSSRPDTFTERDLAIYRQAWAQPSALTAMLNWYRAFPWSRTRQERVRMPVLVLWGARDPALERGLAEASARLCDHVTIRWFERASHWLPREEPQAVNAALIEFLQG